MSTWLYLFLTFTLGWTLFSFEAKSPLTAPELPSSPLWKKNSNSKRLKEDRDILVSVKSEKQDNGKIRFQVQGATLVRGEVQAVYNKATDFSNVAQFSRFFEKAAYDGAAEQTAIDISVMGFETSLLVQVEKQPQKILWKVLRGPFQGLSGAMDFAAHESKETLISVYGMYEPMEAPWSKTWTEWKLEVALEKVAFSLRSYVERSLTK